MKEESLHIEIGYGRRWRLKSGYRTLHTRRLSKNNL